MKKSILMAFLFMLVSGSAYAAALNPGTVSIPSAAIYGGVAGAAATAPTPLIRFSTNVRGIVFVNSTTDYLLATKHDSGSKNFATTNSVTNIYWQQAPTGALTTTTLVGVSDYQSSNLVGNGWTSY